MKRELFEAEFAENAEERIIFDFIFADFSSAYSAISSAAGGKRMYR